MGSKLDIGQKLLRDLRIQKQQMAAARNSETDRYENSRQLLKGTQEAKTIDKIACSDGLAIDHGPIEIRKELLRGAMELEQSLMMLASLQEASEYMKNPHSKTRVKLLENGEYSETDTTTITTDEKRKVERPVFSFDKASKNTKTSRKTAVQQRLLVLTYLKEAPNSPPEMQASMSKSRTSYEHPSSFHTELESSHQSYSCQCKHDARKTPNVVAKLMGLEEFSQSVNTKDAMKDQISKQIPGEVVPKNTGYRSSGNNDFKIAYNQARQNEVQSNKITLLKPHKPELQQETYRFKQGYTYETDHQLEPRCYEGARERSSNHFKESLEAIYKINKLQKETTQVDLLSGSEVVIRNEAGKGSIKQRQGGVRAYMEASQIMLAVKTRSSESTGTIQARRSVYAVTNETDKKAVAESQQRQKEDALLQKPQMLPSYGTQGGKLLSQDRRQQKVDHYSQSRQEDDKFSYKNTRKAIHDTRNSQKQQTTEQPKDRKGKNADVDGITALESTLSSRQNQDPSSINSSSECPRSRQHASLTSTVSSAQIVNDCGLSNVDAKSTNVLEKKLANTTSGACKRTNDVMTETEKIAIKTAQPLKPQKPILSKLKQKLLSKSSSPDRPAPADDNTTEPLQIRASDEASTPEIFEESQQKLDAEQMKTLDVFIRYNSPYQEHQKKLAAPRPTDRNESTPLAVSKQLGQQTTVEDQEDGYRRSRDVLYVSHQEQKRVTRIEKQKPLTEDEMYLKQKLITSHLFLNTAEAFFKLNIPVAILHYASDQICWEKDCKLITDCSYEVMKRKGRKQEMLLHPTTNKFKSCEMISTLDDLVRQLHKDFETLRSYGRNGREEHNVAHQVLNMMERDINNSNPDINCMWDIGWRNIMLAHVEIDDVIRHVEQDVIDEFMNEIAKACM